MSNDQRVELVSLALGVLPELPSVVDVLSEGGGSYELRLSHQEDDLLHGFCAAQAAQPHLHLLARVFDAVELVAYNPCRGIDSGQPARFVRNP